MKAKFGAGQIGGIAGKGGWVEIDGSDITQAAKAFVDNAPALAVLGGLAAWAYTTAQWANPENTAPLGAGPVEVEWEGHKVRGILANSALVFKLRTGKIDVPTGNIVVVHTSPMLSCSRLRILLTDGSEYSDAEFAPGTELKLFTAAGEQRIAPKCRWNFFFERGYKKFRIVGVPTDALKTLVSSLPQLPP